MSGWRCGAKNAPPRMSVILVFAAVVGTRTVVLRVTTASRHSRNLITDTNVRKGLAVLFFICVTRANRWASVPRGFSARRAGRSRVSFVYIVERRLSVI